MTSMNTIIAGIVDDFENDRCDINLVFCDPVMEADETVTSVDDDSNKQNFANSLKTQVSALIKTLKGIIEKAMLKISNFLARVAQTDKGFRKECRQAIVDNKPLEAVKLITYQYNDAVLDQEMNKISSIILDKLQKLKTDYTSESDENTAGDMDRKEADLYAKIFQEMHLPNDVNNINSYFIYVKDKYRTAKKETLFKASETNKYYKEATGFETTRSLINARQKVLAQQTATIQSNLNNIINNKMTQNSIKTRAVHQYKNATHLYNLYVHFLDVYTQLKIEKTLTYRLVLKKLYHF